MLVLACSPILIIQEKRDSYRCVVYVFKFTDRKCADVACLYHFANPYLHLLTRGVTPYANPPPPPPPPNPPSNLSTLHPTSTSTSTTDIIYTTLTIVTILTDKNLYEGPTTRNCCFPIPLPNILSRIFIFWKYVMQLTQFIFISLLSFGIIACSKQPKTFQITIFQEAIKNNFVCWQSCLLFSFHRFILFHSNCM